MLTIDELKEIPGVDDEKAGALQCLFKLESKGALDHQEVLIEANEIIGGHGIEAIHVGDSDYQDGEIQLCPRFSYINLGDTYITTLIRDHAISEWLVTSWGNAYESAEGEAENEAWNEWGASDFVDWLRKLALHHEKLDFDLIPNEILFRAWWALANDLGVDSQIQESDGIYFPFAHAARKATWADARGALVDTLKAARLNNRHA